MSYMTKNEFPKYFNLNGEQIICNEYFTGLVLHEDGTKFWYLNGKNHKMYGPAIEYSDGKKYWFIDGKQVSQLQCKLLHDLMKLKGLL